MHRVTIYTDGACHPNPGKGGWGAWLKFETYDQKLCGGMDNTTNNQMEMMAAVKALESLETPHDVTIWTDSQYLKKGITQWIKGWKKNGWRTRDRKDVKNKDLWVALDEQTNRHNVLWKWVKGHNGNRGNELADQLARNGAKGHVVEGKSDMVTIQVPRKLKDAVYDLIAELT